jgi:lipopolysaccharide export LptBFGC system permease protein LptF
MDDDFLRESREGDFVDERRNRIGAVNVALLFGTAAIALSLILTPIVSQKSDEMQAGATLGYDDIKTGSIPTGDGKVKRYTIRRSVLQDNPGDVCIIDQNGVRNGC